MDFDEDEVLMNQYVNKDKTESVVFIAAKGTRFHKKRILLKFAGLDENKKYTFELNGMLYEKSGAYLNEIGIPAHIRGADYNKILQIKEKQ